MGVSLSITMKIPVQVFKEKKISLNKSTHLYKLSLTRD